MLYTGKVVNKVTGAPLAGLPVTDGRNVVLTRFDGLHTFRVVCYLNNIQTASRRPPGKPHHYTGEEQQI